MRYQRRKARSLLYFHTVLLIHILCTVEGPKHDLYCFKERTLFEQCVISNILTVE